jgi:hypothetical protein
MSCTDELSAVQHSAPPVVPAREQVKKRQQFLHASVRSHAACLRRFRASPPILRQSALCPRLWASAEAQVSLSPPRISSSPHTLPDESRSASSPRSDKLWGVVRISPRVAAIEEPRGQSAVARARRCRCPACSRISPPTTRSRPFAFVCGCFTPRTSNSMQAKMSRARFVSNPLAGRSCREMSSSL